MTAGRLYCIQSWNNASETSGEQIGNRLAQSRGLHFDRNGNANTALYAEEDVKKPTAKKAPLRDRISLADRHFNRIEALSLELDKEYANGMPDEEYYELRAKMDVRLSKAWSRLAKENGWGEDDDHTPSVENNVEIIENKACNSVKADLIMFTTGAAMLLALVKFFF